MAYTSFTTPGSYEQVQSELESQARRRKVIEALQAQNLKQGDSNRMVSGRVVPYGLGEGLTKLASALLSRSQLKDVDSKESELSAEKSEMKSKAAEDVLNTIMGKDAVDEQIGEFDEDLGGYNYEPKQESIEADPMRGAIQGMTTPELEGSGMDKVALAMLKKNKPAASKYKVVPEMQESGLWQNREVINGVKANLVGQPYAKSSGASDISVGGSDKYADERMKKQAQMMDELSAGAKSAYNESLALDRFIAASPDSTAGGAQPIISGVKNMLSSFGYSDESLVDVSTMSQALGDMKVNKIAQFGARGLTDKDMEIINMSMPRVETSHDARIAVAQILKKIKDSEVQNYIYALDQEKEKHPNVSAGVITPRWLDEYQDKKDNTFDPNNIPEGIDPEDWKYMSDEDRALFQ